MTTPNRAEFDASADRVIDAGDLGCGELLLELVAPMRTLPPGRIVRLVTSDPGAPADIPAWCRLTGHLYLGSGQQDDGRPHHDIQVRERP